MTKTEAMTLIELELDRAMEMYPLFNSRHEGYAVMKEEVDELWSGIKKDEYNLSVQEEAAQVGAMAAKFLMSIEGFKRDV